MKIKSFFLKIALGLLLTVGAGWWVLQSISLVEIAELFEDAALPWILIGFGFYLIAFAARVGRFAVLFSSNEISQESLSGITGVHNLATRLLPNPTGEAAFFYLARREGITAGSVVAALVAYRLLDFAAVALYLSIGAAVSLGFRGNGTSALFLAIAVCFACMPFIIGSFAKYGGSIAGKKKKHASSGISAVIGWFRKKVAESLEAMQILFAKKGVYRWAVTYSLLLWLSMAVSYYMFFRAFGGSFDFFAVLFAGMTQVFVNVLPSIAGVGVMEAGWVLGFATLGVSKEVALRGAIGVDAMTLLGTLGIGAVSWLRIIRTQRKTI